MPTMPMAAIYSGGLPDQNSAVSDKKRERRAAG